jgi:hypothetical protein
VSWEFDSALKRWKTVHDSTGYILANYAASVTRPFHMCAWGKAPDVTGAHSLIGLFKRNPASQSVEAGRYIQLSGHVTDDPVEAVDFADAGWSGGNAGRYYADTWTHVAGLFVSNTSRSAYCNAVVGSPNAITRTNTGFDSTVIGGYLSYAANIGATAEVADVLIYNRQLTLGELQQLANPSNYMLSGLIVPSSPPSGVQPLPINDRHWVGRSPDWHSADNWSRSQGGRGGAGVPNERTNVLFD